MSPKQIFFIRHGETDWNREELVQGQKESALSDRGFDQARRLAQRLKKESIQVIYSSPLRRARQTSQEVKKLIGVGINFDDNLKEISLGRWEGLSREDIKREYPLEFEQWLKNPATLKAPDGESWHDVRKRANDFFNMVIVRSLHERILVSSHNGFGKLFMIDFMGMDLSKFWNFNLNNGSLSLLVLHDNGRREMALLNDCCHLVGTDTLSDVRVL
ncbi:MAG: histidine phosphatase family protein [Actinobacteria bacterium]|nr:histidine phosphatase family protein [Actinomycetota bacterium]